MKKCRVELYIFEILRVDRRGGPLLLGSFNGRGGAIGALNTIFSDIGSHRKIEALGKTISVEFDNSTEQELTGTIRVGEYGYETSIVNIDSGGEAYRKKKNEANLEPFVFYIYAPPNGTQGLIMLPRYGADGVKTIVDGLVSPMFSADNPEYRLQIKAIVVSEYIRSIVDRGEIDEITIEKYEIPADIADRFSIRGIPSGKLRTTIKPDDKSLFNKDGIISVINGNAPLGSVFNLDDGGEIKITAKLKLDGSTRTININNPYKIHASYDITELVNEGLDGYPDKSSLLQHMKLIAKDIAQRAGL